MTDKERRDKYEKKMLLVMVKDLNKRRIHNSAVAIMKYHYITLAGSIK